MTGKPRGAYQPRLDPETAGRLKVVARQGLSQVELGQRFGRRQSTIRSWLIRLGLLQAWRAARFLLIKRVIKVSAGRSTYLSGERMADGRDMEIGPIAFRPAQAAGLLIRRAVGSPRLTPRLV
jgi:hypothetical protein